MSATDYEKRFMKYPSYIDGFRAYGMKYLRSKTKTDIYTFGDHEFHFCASCGFVRVHLSGQEKAEKIYHNRIHQLTRPENHSTEILKYLLAKFPKDENGKITFAIE